MVSNNPEIPISVIVVTKNEETRIAKCLDSLQNFDEIIVVDSGSSDKTKEISNTYGVRVFDFKWNKQYPKKRQWCLDNLDIKHDYVFFVDADEIVTPELAQDMRELDFLKAGYFIKGQYIMDGKPLKYGLQNNKLCLINRHKFEFPVIDDLNIEGMDEIEGHYQPVPKKTYSQEKIGQLNNALIHDAFDNWEERHQKYAKWESEINKRDAWPKDPSPPREFMKRTFRVLPIRGIIAFIHSYIFKFGFLDGARGLKFANMRRRYYKKISQLS